ncbi:MAG: hypothetical protein KF760_27295 [Candidatus Eremiobacteraeota bacterium]|nr:hypothetical protein [Candidatus Eremiobacteraeota bacterium]MCW5872429.1 hypothetical protein [Candidatus Eremiobacteraeota bacterium]
MWASDHNGKYPQNLSELTPNYLKHLLPGPQGSTEEVRYLVDQNQENYQLKVVGNRFKEIQISGSYPQYSSDQGLMLTENGKLPRLPLNLLNPQLDASWKSLERPLGLSWKRGSEHIFSSLYLTQVESEAERYYLNGYSNEAETVEGERIGSAGQRLKLVRGTHYLELRSLQGDTLRLLKYETEAPQLDGAVTQEFRRLLAGL